ncbi:Cu-binding protein, partial [Irineochytrium annulatum]
VLGWRSIGALGLSGLLLYTYFHYEKRKLEDRRKASVNEAAGKPLVGGPFTLVNTDGQPVTDLDFRGKYMIIYFGYTFCPDVCPEELEKMAKVLDRLKAKYGESPVVPIFISCDPKRDSLQSIREYLKDFHPDYVGLTGTHAQIKRAAKLYRLYYSAPPKAVDDDEADYLVDHSIFFYMMGPDGKYVEHFGKQETSDSLTEKIMAIIDAERGRK